VNFFMSLMHILSPDENFPMWKEVKAACETAKKERTAAMQETLERARIYFHVCPGNLDALPPAFLNQVDGAFLKVFAPLLGRTGGSDAASWRKAHLAYMTQVGGILNEYIARPTSTMIPVPARASARMWYYLEALSAKVYIPTATALVKTSEMLFGAGLGICEASAI
jgi:hypothetical protein